MEETKWLTKSKIIIIASILVVIIGIVVGIFIHRNSLKKDYIEFQNQLEYAAPNYLLKEKIKLYEYEWREINIKDILKQKLVANERASDCEGYVIAEALKDTSIDIEESTSNINDEASTTESEDNSSTDNQAETSEDDKGKNISSNITYKAYIKCKKIYTTDGYGVKPDSKNKNDDETQSEKDTEKPVIELFGDETITLTVGDKYKELGAIATDNIDGDITKKLKISGKVNTKKAGEYIVKYSVKDSAGNKANKERKVIVEEKKEETPNETPETPNNNVDNNINTTPNNNTDNNQKDTTSPIITFNISDSYQTICAGKSADISVNGIYGFVARDNVDGNITSKVNITGDIGVINTPGDNYTIYYSVSDSSGNSTTASKKFTVKDCSSSIPDTNTTIPVDTIRCTSLSLSVGESKALEVTISPNNATNKNLTYKSSNESVATISNGIVKGISSGSATITVKSSSKVGICTVRVN